MIKRKRSGYTLIEVLIALLIVAIGMLGVLSLQIVAKQSTHQSLQRSRAVALADEMVERIRINPAGITTYNLGIDAPLGGGTITSEPDPNCRSSICTPVQLALHDLWMWEQEMDGALSNVGGVNTAGLIKPHGCIIFTADTGRTSTGLVTVLLQWQGTLQSYDAVQASEQACGGAAAGSDNYRRQVRVDTFVIDETEF